MREFFNGKGLQNWREIYFSIYLLGILAALIYLGLNAYQLEGCAGCLQMAAGMAQ